MVDSTKVSASRPPRPLLAYHAHAGEKRQTKFQRESILPNVAFNPNNPGKGDCMAKKTCLFIVYKIINEHVSQQRATTEVLRVHLLKSFLVQPSPAIPG